jgi:hypothetical protein
MNKTNSGPNNQLPDFIITMLGGSGVGKTVFMACMYVALSAKNDLSIEAEPDLDRNLREIYRNILNGELPSGTVGVESAYDFYLLVNNRRVAKINWVDYRGGAIEDDSSEDDADYLHERIRNSDAVLIMLDLSSEILKSYEVGGVLANYHLRVGRIKNLIITQNINRRIKSVIFVRTKSDLVTDANGKPDLKTACDELVAQLKDNISFRDIPVSAAIATSSCKVIHDENGKKVEPSEPINTEWVLFIALKDLLSDIKNVCESKVIRFKKLLEQKEEEKKNVKNIPISVKEIFSRRNIEKERELELSREASELATRISAEQMYLRKLEEAIEKIKDKLPSDQVRIFPNNEG